jgi:hypothetical protein
LRAGDARDLVVDIRGVDREIRALGLEVADVAEERRISWAVERRPAMLAVPGVDRRLQRVTPAQQRAVARRQPAHELVESRPQRGRLDAGAGQNLQLDEVVEHLGDLQSAERHALQLRHLSSPFGLSIRPRPGQALPPRRRKR